MSRTSSVLWCAAAVLLSGLRTDPVQAAPGTLADSNGQVVGWGDNSFGQTNVPSGTFTAIAAGNFHSLGIQSDGTLAGWGDNGQGQTTVPSGTFIAIAAGNFHSLGIQSDGTLAGWGLSAAGQTTVPSGTFTAIAAGGYHSLGIRSDGTLAGWGSNSNDQLNVPSGTFTAIAAGNFHSLGIRSDGTLAAWGYNGQGQTTVPSGTFAAIAAGNIHSLGIRSDGTLAGWGDNSFGQTNVPSGTFTAIAAGNFHSLGIQSDGTLAGWGDNSKGQTTVPSGTFVAVSAKADFSLALEAQTNYSGDLLVNYAGSASGPNGLKANLNRSVSVAGNALIQSPMYLFNNPLLSVAGNVSFSGTGSAVGTGTIAAGGGLVVASGLTFTIPAMLTLIAAGPLMGGGNIQLNGSYLSAGLTNASSFTGALTLNSGSTLGFTGSGIVTPSSLTVNSGSSLRLTAGQQLAISGLMTNNGVLQFSGGNTAIRGDVTNNASGRIFTAGGSVTSFFDDVHSEGSIFTNAGARTVFFGSYSGAGSLPGGGTNEFVGDTRPGNSPASVQIGGTAVFDSAARLFIEIGGTTPGTQFDQVHVTGQLSLGGTLNVSLINGFQPVLGNSFHILDWGTRSGTFATLQLPAITGGPWGWDASQLYTTGMLSVVTTYLKGDWNRDGQVTAADIPAMLSALTDLNSYASSNTLSAAQLAAIGDFDNSGTITNRDLQGLLDLVASGGGSVAAVPEPAAGVLMTSGGVMALLLFHLRLDALARLQGDLARRSMSPFHTFVRQRTE